MSANTRPDQSVGKSGAERLQEQLGARGGPQRHLHSGEKALNTGAALRRIWGYVSRQQRILVIVISVILLAAALGLLGPLLIGQAIDNYIVPRDYDGLLMLCVSLAGLYAAASLLNGIQSYMMVGIAQRTVRQLREEIFAHLQVLPVPYYDQAKHGDLMSRTTNDVDNVNTTLSQSFTQIVTSLATVIGALGLMMWLNIWLTLVTLVTAPLLMLATRTIAKYTRRLFGQQQEALGELNAYAEESISGQKVVKLYRREARAEQSFGAINERLRKAATGAQNLAGTFGPTMNLLNHLVFIMLATLGGWMVFNDWTTIGIVISFLQLSRMFSGPLNDLANQYNMIQSGIAGAERVFELLDTPGEYSQSTKTNTKNISTTTKRPNDDISGEVVFDEVDFSYSPAKRTLEQVSFVARPGQMVALVGPTGAGKTTIVNLLTRFYEIDQGRITIDQVDIRELDKKALRSQLGIVLQDAYLFSGTIGDNIRYGRLQASDEEVESAATLANAHDFISKLPEGYQTMLAAEGGNLSHGQRQLLTIARAILADPAILILDEATSSIDTRTEMNLHAAMNTLMQGRTSFVIAHRLSTIRQADLILVMDQGRIVERGTHVQLLQQQGFYYQLYHTQFEQQEESVS